MPRWLNSIGLFFAKTTCMTLLLVAFGMQEAIYAFLLAAGLFVISRSTANIVAFIVAARIPGYRAYLSRWALWQSRDEKGPEPEPPDMEPFKLFKVGVYTTVITAFLLLNALAWLYPDALADVSELKIVWASIGVLVLEEVRVQVVQPWLNGEPS